MPPKTTVEQFVTKHATNLKASVPYIRTGVERLTVSPTETAIAHAADYVAGVEEAVRDGRWQAGLRRVSLQDWRDKMINIGLPRIAGGIDANRAKMTSFATALLAQEANLMTTIERMPSLTLEDSIARATAWIRGMAGWSWIGQRPVG